MAHSLDLQVVIEGVENAEQYAFIEAHEGDYIQGNYFCRPVSADDIPFHFR